MISNSMYSKQTNNKSANFFLSLILAMLSVLFYPKNAVALNLSLDISKHYITVTSSYRGAEVLIFGSSDYDGSDDIVITIVGPATNMTLSKKERKFGVWSNSEVKQYQNIPGFFIQSSTRDIQTLLPEDQISKLKLNYASYLTKTSDQNPEEVANLISALEFKGLHQSGYANTIKRQNKLFRLDNLIPASASPGLYSVTGYLIKDGEVVGDDVLSIWVKKDGFSEWIADFSKNYSLLYGLLWAMIVICTGFIINFIKIRKYS